MQSVINLHLEIITVNWPPKYLNLLLIVIEETTAIFQGAKSVFFPASLRILRILSLCANVYAAQYNTETYHTCDQIAIIL